MSRHNAAVVVHIDETLSDGEIHAMTQPLSLDQFQHLSTT